MTGISTGNSLRLFVGVGIRHNEGGPRRRVGAIPGVQLIVSGFKRARLLKGSLGEFPGGKPNLDLVLRFSSDRRFTWRAASLSGFGHPRVDIFAQDLDGISDQESVSHLNQKVAIIS